MIPARLLVAGDPGQLTGGYLYDAHVAAGLGRRGFAIETVGLAGHFPEPDPAALAAMDAALAACADGALVVVDGLALGGCPDAAAPHAQRLCLVALVHHPLADEWGLAPERAARLRASERRALALARHVIVTSPFTARHVRDAYSVPPARISVVEPGVARRNVPPRAAHAVPRLLCVATVVPRKDHALLVEALAQVADLPWRCDCIGDAGRDPACARAVRAALAVHGLSARIALRGTVAQATLDATYRAADLFVLPSRYEGYGMAVAEAISFGLPVVTTTGGALVDTLPEGAGMAVAPGDAGAFAAALRALLSSPERLAACARTAQVAARRLPTWDQAAERFAAVLTAVAAGVAPPNMQAVPA